MTTSWSIVDGDAKLASLAPPNYSEVDAPQVDPEKSVGDRLSRQPPPQHLRTKQIFNVDFENNCFD